MGVVQCQCNKKGCHGNHIKWILCIMIVLKRGVEGLHIQLSIINIIQMGEGDTLFLIFPMLLTPYMVAMATILAEYYVKWHFWQGRCYI